MRFAKVVLPLTSAGALGVIGTLWAWNSGSQQSRMPGCQYIRNMASSSSSKGIQFGSAWFQRKIHLRPQHRGIHLVTEEILRQLPELAMFSMGLMHIQILHTSASLALNENWDPDVRVDMEMMLNKIVPEGMSYQHSCEGPDDMPAHVKACFLGSSLTVPITDGRLNVGTWQGIWLCEHRNRAGSRKVVVTLSGCLKDSPGASGSGVAQNPGSAGGRSPNTTNNSPGPSS
ncbi:unnamed protein product [Darwinula stevensoni]|uniref:Uncharacterized protein n=1 Tax=Darwinula stevensoni TaxID=69355 RepID=A0A7R9A7H6_9CRUS|nr:unnamed protein product [Darwinula stevensoni]CAG0891868.1 unnamed protein product [Darwinula stevensoni]